MSQTGATAKFLQGDLMRHVLTMALSSSIGLMTMFVVDFVDLYFIALIGDTSLTAGVGFAGTLIFFNISVAIGLLIAMSALTSRKLGSGDEQGARKMATNILALALIIGTAMGLFMYIAAPGLLALVGASGAAQEAGTQDLRIIAFSVPILTLGMCCNGMLTARGDARRAMMANAGGAIVNAVLDPILIFGFGLDLQGAALASVAARITMAGISVYPVLTKYGGFAPFKASLFFEDLKPIVAIAGPAMLTNVATPVGMLIVTRYISDFGDDAIAGLAVINRITPLAFCVIYAISGAVGPIIGQNFGAGEYGRVRETLRKASIFIACYVGAAWLIMPFASGVFADIFKLGEDGRTLVWTFAVIGTPLFFFNGVTFIANAAFNNLNRPLWSTLFNWGKNTIGVLPFVFIGSHLAGAPGVLIAPAVGGVIFALFALRLGFHLVGLYEKGAVDPAIPWRPDVMSWFRAAKP